MRFAASPLARRLARENHLDLARIQGSGPKGRIIKRDIDKARAQSSSAQKSNRNQRANASPPPSLPDPRLYYDAQDYILKPLSLMQKAIAQKMARSTQTIPHYQTSMRYDMGGLLAMIASVNDFLSDFPSDFISAKKYQHHLSLNDFLILACAQALMEVPDINISFTDEALLHHKNADISVAIALEDGGLISPIIKKAQNKTIIEISQEAKSLTKLARARKLKPAQYEGGSFSLSNLGMFGVAHFTAIINPPQAAILAIGTINPNQEMEVTISCDHRAINGATAARFLNILGELIQNPHWLWLKRL